MARAAASLRETCGNRAGAWHIRQVIRRPPDPRACSMTLSFDRPAHRPRLAPASPQPSVPLAARRRARGGAMALVAYLLWPTWGRRSGSDPDRLPVSVGDTLFDVPTAAIRDENPAPFRAAGAHRSRLRLSLAEPPEAPKHVSADTVEEQRRRSTASSCRSRRITTRWRPTCACARSIRAISNRPRRQDEDGLTQRAFRDGTPYGNEDSSRPTRRNSSRAARAMRARPACA